MKGHSATATAGHRAPGGGGGLCRDVGKLRLAGLPCLTQSITNKHKPPSHTPTLYWLRSKKCCHHWKVYTWSVENSMSATLAGMSHHLRRLSAGSGPPSLSTSDGCSSLRRVIAGGQREEALLCSCQQTDATQRIFYIATGIHRAHTNMQSLSALEAMQLATQRANQAAAILMSTAQRAPTCSPPLPRTGPWAPHPPWTHSQAACVRVCVNLSAHTHYKCVRVCVCVERGRASP